MACLFLMTMDLRSPRHSSQVGVSGRIGNTASVVAKKHAHVTLLSPSSTPRAGKRKGDETCFLLLKDQKLTSWWSNKLNLPQLHIQQQQLRGWAAPCYRKEAWRYLPESYSVTVQRRRRRTHKVELPESIGINSNGDWANIGNGILESIFVTLGDISEALDNSWAGSLVQKFQYVLNLS